MICKKQRLNRRMQGRVKDSGAGDPERDTRIWSGGSAVVDG